MHNFIARMLVGLAFCLPFNGNCVSPRQLDSLIRAIPKSFDTTALNLLNQIAWEYRNIDLSKTDSFAQVAINLSQQLPYEKGIGQGYLCKALVERNAGNYKLTIHYAQWALIHFIKCKWMPGYSSVYNTIASAHSIQGHYPIALYYYLESLKISEQINDVNGTARTLNNIGVVYEEQSQLDKALYYYQKAYRLLDSSHDYNALADELNNIGNVYHEKLEYAKAISCYERSTQINAENNDIKDVAVGYNNIGSVYSGMGDYKKALDSYFRSLKLNEQLGDVESIVLLYENIANCYHKLSMLHSATQYVNLSLELAQKHNLRSGSMTAYHMLSKIEEANNNYKEALRYHELYKAYSDSLYNEESGSQISQLEEQYQKEKNERQQVILEKDRQWHQRIEDETQKRISEYVLTIGLVLFIFILLIYLVFFIVKRPKGTT